MEETLVLSDSRPGHTHLFPLFTLLDPPPPPPRFFLCRLSAGFAGLSEQPEIAARNFSTIAKDDIGEFWEWETGTNGIAAGTVGGACGHWRVDPRKVARDVKLGLLKNHFRPDRKFSFPARQVGKKQLKFQCSWLEQNPWLVSSPRTNAGFCLPCTLFGGEEDRFGHQLGQLHRSPIGQLWPLNDDVQDTPRTAFPPRSDR